METVGLLATELNVFVPARNFLRFTAVMQTSLVLGMEIRQARDASGTDSKKVSGTEVTSPDPGVFEISITADELDATHPPGQQFDHIEVNIFSGGAGQTLLGLFGENPILSPPRDIVPIVAEGGV